LLRKRIKRNPNSLMGNIEVRGKLRKSCCVQIKDEFHPAS